MLLTLVLIFLLARLQPYKTKKEQYAKSHSKTINQHQDSTQKGQNRSRKIRKTRSLRHRQ
ncbi:hypothetical protein HAL011_05420 [Helicobacter ailurogastricus]|uniref:Uncharacterized protein n=1 Tax=Helicobacter ailurogastricus TaxID=1578720 RepID=A0A0K2X7V4_9HELI|nr:hypothetical protein HAL011_05420 [Helicobacter ailurogastricus]